MAFFLTRPAASDTETATTARAFEGGADAEVQARDLRQKLAAEKERNDADNATKLAEKQQAQTAAQSVARLKLLHDNSEKSYEEANTELQDALKTKGIDPAARSQLIERQVALRKTHATDATGTVDYSGYGTSAQPKITPEQTNVNEAEKLKILKEGAEAKAKIEELSGGNAGGGGKAVKIPQAAITARAAIDEGQSNLAALTNDYMRLRDANKLTAEGKPENPDVDHQFRQADAALGAGVAKFTGGYAKHINEIMAGVYGPRPQKVLQTIASKLPNGLSVADPQAYAIIKAGIAEANAGGGSPQLKQALGEIDAMLPSQDPAAVIGQVTFTTTTKPTLDRLRALYDADKNSRSVNGEPPPHAEVSAGPTGSPTGAMPIGAPPTDGSINANPAGGNSAGFSGTTGAPTVPWDGGDR